MKNKEIYKGWTWYRDVDEIQIYIKDLCSGMWAVSERPDGMKLLYKLKDLEYNFTGFEFESFDEVEKYIADKNDIL